MEGSKASGIGFNFLDSTIESLGDSISDRVEKVVEESAQMVLEALSRLLDRFQPAAYRAAIPLGEKGFHMPLTFLLAEGGDGLADRCT